MSYSDIINNNRILIMRNRRLVVGSLFKSPRFPSFGGSSLSVDVEHQPFIFIKKIRGGRLFIFNTYLVFVSCNRYTSTVIDSSLNLNFFFRVYLKFRYGCLWLVVPILPIVPFIYSRVMWVLISFLSAMLWWCGNLFVGCFHKVALLVPLYFRA